MPRKKPSASSAANELPLAPPGLAGKKAGEQAIVRWVSRNIDTADPDPEECPDPFAWTLLRQCRGDATFLSFFIEKLWVKLIPSRSQLDTRTTATLDGQPTLELIARIQGIRDEAMGGSSQPSPSPEEPPPDVFEAFDPEEDEL